MRARIKRAEMVRKRGEEEEEERVRRRRAHLGRQEHQGGGGHVNLGLRVDEMELRERRLGEETREVVRSSSVKAGGGNLRGRRGSGSGRSRQSNITPAQQQESLGVSVLGEESQRGRSRRGSSPSQLATIHEPGEEHLGREEHLEREEHLGREEQSLVLVGRGGVVEPEVVIRVTDLCKSGTTT